MAKRVIDSNGYRLKTLGRCVTTGKLRFASRGTAKYSAKVLQAKIGMKVHPYLCVVCQSYHLGHRPPHQVLTRVRNA